MCESIRQAREELIRQERIATIGQLSTSIVHDLRNPLAAIYAGAEMLMDSNLPEEQTRRLARNIYRASRGIQDMLQELLDVVRGTSGGSEMCSLREVIAAAWATVAPPGRCPQNGTECRSARRPGMPHGARPDGARVLQPVRECHRGHAFRRNGFRFDRRWMATTFWCDVEDTGPGISPALRGRLFQPFVTAGKKNGLGLGLALSRQTLLDHGGDMWADANGPGARFCLRLPKERRGVAHEVNAVKLAGE